MVIPDGISRMERLVVYKTLLAIKAEILVGRFSGAVIDQALEEALEECRAQGSL